jgi:uncharacterized protein (TIGR00297 family)
VRNPLDPIELIGGSLLSIFIGVIGYRRGALSESGVAGAFVTGAVIFGVGGWEWGLLLIAFFLSSSALSFYRMGEKRLVAEKFAKGHRRDLGQALANAGVAAVLAILSRCWPHPLWLFGCAGAFAAVNADTWATELGVLSRKPPRLVTTGQRVTAGTSGGISGLGTLAGLGGAWSVGLVAALGVIAAGERACAAGVLLVAATVGGLAGSFADSVLGATVQAIYHCAGCDVETERRIHRCGRETRLARGWRWMNNDVVNAIASAVGAAVTLVVGWAILRGGVA